LDRLLGHFIVGKKAQKSILTLFLMGSAEALLPSQWNGNSELVGEKGTCAFSHFLEWMLILIWQKIDINWTAFHSLS